MSPLGIAQWKIDFCSQKWGIAPNGGVTNEPPWDSTMENRICSQKWGIAPNGGVTNEPPWGSTMENRK